MAFFVPVQIKDFQIYRLHYDASVDVIEAR
jgi:hypothetical protein